jgi:hypothetical protein
MLAVIILVAMEAHSLQFIQNVDVRAARGGGGSATQLVTEVK